MFSSLKSYFFSGAEEDKIQNPSTMKPSDPKSYFGQTVKFEGTDEQHSTEITSEDVTIIPSTGTHDKSSSSVKTKNIVDHSWDVRFYKGQLLAVHISGKFIAFGLQVIPKNESMVRIVNRQNNHRYLCKGITGLVQDIAFAHIPTQVLLGIVDEAGTLFVYKIQDTLDALQTKLMLHITQNLETKTPGMIHRLIWCPYIPEEDGEDTKDSEYEEVANMLVVTHGPRAEMWNVGMIVQTHGMEKELHPEDIKEGMLVLNEHTMDIVDAAFSPDGTALATASLDGYVKFFQAENELPLVCSSDEKVYMPGGGKPRCLHMWQPHDGKPLSSLFFLDNHRTFSADVQFWKYAVTGSDNNSELKIWSCQTWSCLQTIKFAPNPTSTMPGNMSLKAGIDLSADFIMLSDINNRVLYVLQLRKDVEESAARVCAVSEFLLPHPILSFGIVDAGIRYIKSHDGSNDLETDLVESNENSDCGEDDDEEKTLQVVVRMYVVHPKSLRGCIITFDPPKASQKTLSAFSQDSLRSDESPVLVNDPSVILVEADGMSEIELPSRAITVFSEGLSDISDNAREKKTTLALTGADLPMGTSTISEPMCLNNLMTPDDFSSSNEKKQEVERSSPLIPVNEHFAERSGEHIVERSPEKKADSSTRHEASHNRILKTKGKSSGKAMSDIGVKRSREPTASGGSSPSREVEEILSHGSSDRLSSTMSYGYPSATIPEDVSSSDSVPPGTTKVESPHERDELAEAVASLKLGLVCSDKKSTIQTTPEVNSTLVTPLECSRLFSAGNTSNPLSATLPIPIPTSLPPVTTTSALQAVVAAAAAQEKPVMVTAEQLEKRSREDLLLESLQQQSSEIKSLKQEISALRLSRTASADPQIVEKVQAMMHTQHKQQELVLQNAVQSAVQTAIQATMRQRDQQEALRHEALLSTISQSVANLVTLQLPSLISQEMKNEVVPLVRNTVQQMKQQVNADVATKLASTDHLMRENITKLVSSKATMDLLSQSILTMVHPAMQNLYKESFSAFVPGMEKITQNMFHQINSSFSKGTQEYMQYVDSNLEKQKRQAERVQDLLLQLQSVADSIRVTHEQQNQVLKNMLETQLQRLQNSLQDKLNKTVSETVKGNLAQGFKQQKAVIEESVLTSLTAVRSRAVSPAHVVPDYATTERCILQHIQDGEYNSAFQQALSASNISLVLLACERVDPQKLFSCQPLPLKQNILLSLIQQLSTDLNDHTDLKRRYLEEAVLSLDQADPDVRKHLYIIGNLQNQLKAYMHSHPNSPVTRQMKILFMATSNLTVPASPS